MTKEQLLIEVEDLISNAPDLPTFRHSTEENASWYGRVGAVIESWNISKTIEVNSSVHLIQNGVPRSAQAAFFKIKTLLHQARATLTMETRGPTNIAVGHKMVFDYFDEIRKIIKMANNELFFIDPFLDADFVSRYLPNAPTGVKIRLLGREHISTLVPAAKAFGTQNGAKIEVRSASKFHDRYLFLDSNTCYQSGASFKDGGRTAPTTVTQITDAFQAVRDTYENMWLSAKVVT